MTELLPFQKRGVRRLRKCGGRTLLCDEMGLGKTIQCLAYIAEEKLRPVVVVCPNSVKWHWPKQAALHRNLRAEVLSGTKIPPRMLSSPAKLIVLNWDILHAWIPFLKNLQPELVIGDEIQAIKNPKARRTKAFRELCRGIPRIIGVSGTPINNRPAEFYPILNILWPERFKSFFVYGHRFCGPKRRPWSWEYKGATNIPELNRILKECGMIRRRKEKVLKELPNKIRTVLPVDLSSRREYREAESAFISWLRKHFGKRKADRAASAERLVRAGYLKRLAAQLKLPATLEWIDEFLEGTDEKLIVFGIHKAFIASVQDRYRGISVKVDGSVKGKDRHLAVEQFRHSKKTRLFIGNINAAGTGWDGSCATSVGILELPWTPGEVNQASDRPHRIGQKSVVNVTFLVARGTIEESLCKLLQEKQEVLRSVLDGDHDGESLDLMDQLTEILLRKGDR